MTDETESPTHTTSADKLEVVGYVKEGGYRASGFEYISERSIDVLCVPLVRQSDATRIITEQAERIAELETEVEALSESRAFLKANSEEWSRCAFRARSRSDRMKEALRALLDEETISVHVGYDNGVGGGNFIYADAVRTDSAAFANARAALGGQSNE